MVPPHCYSVSDAACVAISLSLISIFPACLLLLWPLSHPSPRGVYVYVGTPPLLRVKLSDHMQKEEDGAVVLLVGVGTDGETDTAETVFFVGVGRAA